MARKIDNIIDSIQSPQTTGRAIPSEIMHANVVLGYIAGNSWLTDPIYRRARPDLDKQGLVIPVSLTYAVPRGIKWCMYDIEPGGGVNGNIGAFAARVDKSEPFLLYTFASNGSAMLNAARGFGYKQGEDFFYVAAHATGVPHICAPNVCGYPRSDWTQYLFAGLFDKSMAWDYALPGYKTAPAIDPLRIFPKDVGDKRMPNHGNEHLTVAQCDGALQHINHSKHPDYTNYLRGKLRAEIKAYRDRCMRLAKYEPPTYTKKRPKPLWNDGRHLGARWQGLNNRMKKIDAIK